MKQAAKAERIKKIYFICAVAGGRDHAFVYQDIVDLIKAQGVEVLGETLANPNIESENLLNPLYTPSYVWKRDTDWVHQIDGVIAEVTQPSLGVGYIIALAESLQVPVLALFYKKSYRRLSPMVQGSPHIQAFEYASHAETEKIIKQFIDQLPQPNSA
jgi:hypothetical protein